MRNKVVSARLKCKLQFVGQILAIWEMQKRREKKTKKFEKYRDSNVDVDGDDEKMNHCCDRV